MMFEEQIEVLSFELERISATDAGCTRIRKIPGIGTIVATAIVAAIATELPSASDGTLLRGLDWCHGSTPPAVRRSCLHQ
jgi:transposase